MAGRIGVLGGTFDPIHNGHLAAAAGARHDLGLDVVLLVVAGDPWQKSSRRPVSPARDRLDLVEAAVAGVEGVEASSIEVDRAGPSYTADTLDALAEAHPGAELHVIIGSDLAGELVTWHQHERIRDRAHLAVVRRPGHPPAEMPGWRVSEVEIPALDISSTDIRARVGAGRPVDGLVPVPCVPLITQRGMYAGPR